MAFNLDDPLGDLLSDNGSEDSFADFLAKKPSAAGKTASKVNNLFGISDSGTEPTPVSKITETVNKPPPATQPAPIIKKTEPVVSKPVESYKNADTKTPPKKEITFDDNNDIFADLGFDPKKPKSGLAKRSNILDDLLGISDAKTPPRTTPARTPPEPKNQTLNENPTRPIIKPISRQATQERIEIVPKERAEEMSNTYVGPSSRPRTANSSKRNSNADKPSDPLGFFGSTQMTEARKPDSVKPPPMLDWLGVGTTSVQSNEMQPVQPPPVPNPITSFQQQPPPPQPTIIQSTPDHLLANIFKPNLSQTAQLLTNANSDANAAMYNLQQQESQLLIANQMKNQEAVLVDLQRRQHEMLQQQEHNFNALLQKQLQRQGALEDNIRLQQERINSHINMLMNQPSTILPTVEVAPTSDNGLGDLLSKGSGETLVEMKVEIKRLEMENLRLSDMCEHSKENHDQELDLLETTHRKQMSLVEENLKKLETRLRDENVRLEEFYGKKLDEMISEKQQMMVGYESKIEKLIEEHAGTVERLNTAHGEEVKQMRADHLAMIDNLRQSKNMEFSLIQENSSYLQTLKSASGFLETASEDLQTIRHDFESKIDQINHEREIKLVAREKRVEEQQNHFEKLRESTAAEREALLDLVRTLETKLNAVNQSAEEEQWASRQQRATLDAERAAFERERSFMRERLDREEKRLEDLRATHAEDNQRLLKQIEDDRLQVIAEKMKLETQARLQRSQNVNVSRAEIEAAVQVAQDAARQHDLERERLMEMQRKFETRRRELIDQENAVRSKQTDLDTTMNALLIKERSANAKMAACKTLEQQFLQKLRLLHQNVTDVTARETKLSQDRYDLSRERLEMQALRRKLYQSRCSLCKIGERSQELSDMLTKTGDDDPTAAVNADRPILDLDPVLGDLTRLTGGSNMDEFFDREVRFELDKLRQMDVSTGQGDVGDKVLLDAELMMHRFDVLKGDFSDCVE